MEGGIRPQHIVDMNDYEYEGSDGFLYRGVSAYVLNHLDSAEACCLAEADRKTAGMNPTQAEVWEALRLLLDHPAELAQYL